MRGSVCLFKDVSAGARYFLLRGGLAILWCLWPLLGFRWLLFEGSPI